MTRVRVYECVCVHQGDAERDSLRLHKIIIVHANERLPGGLCTARVRVCLCDARRRLPLRGWVDAFCDCSRTCRQHMHTYFVHRMAWIYFRAHVNVICVYAKCRMMMPVWCPLFK